MGGSAGDRMSFVDRVMNTLAYLRYVSSSFIRVGSVDFLPFARSLALPVLPSKKRNIIFRMDNFIEYNLDLYQALFGRSMSQPPNIRVINYNLI